MGYFEVDFLAVETAKSGDAICIRYEIGGQVRVHVTDGGFSSTGEKVVEHLESVYGTNYVDHVVLTHPDADHACGLQTVLEECSVGTLWMLRPWLYAEEIIDRFETYNSVDALKSKLRSLYPYVAALEVLADDKGIPIYEPFQGAAIGAFHVLAPSRARYLDCIVNSEKTPEAVEEAGLVSAIESVFAKAAKLAVNLVKAAWGDEVFSTEETSAENEMSVVQYALLEDERILLTGDAGRQALAEAADYAPYAGLALPGIDRAQVPHHGSRRNVSTDVLDRWFGERLGYFGDTSRSFTAIVSSAKEDEHHPRNAVVRAFIHRGANVYATEGSSIRTAGGAAPSRNWGPATALSYPDEQEE
jgi:beta-lactamase superfamily II metal-dependent hydrolase